ncbi:MAG TPA: hypothetical protein VNN18_09665 [Candidatus Xenobia bacterium]|nr:hypothetical protein [Candidatus Xenobia bacterium]
MNDTLLEMARYTGKAAGILLRDLAEISPPLTEAFLRGWREKKIDDEPARASATAPESA